MSIVVLILLGLIVGCVARGFFKPTGKGVVLDFGCGVSGAVIAGSLFNHMAATGGVGLNVASALATALTGAAALLATSHALRGTRYLRRDPI